MRIGSRFDRRLIWQLVSTVLLALCLTALPLPSWVVWFRPEWALLVVIFWLIRFPEAFGLGWAWIIGLLMDGLTGTPVLGAHAVAMVLVARVVSHIHLRMRLFSIHKQMWVVGVLTLVYKLVIFMILGLTSVFPSPLLYWLPCLTSSMLWPWVFALLSGLARRPSFLRASRLRT